MTNDTQLDVYTLNWVGDHARQNNQDDDPSALVHLKVFLNGRLIEGANQITYQAGPDFGEVWIRLLPSNINVYCVDEDEWDTIA